MYNYSYEAACVNFTETHWVRNYEIYKRWIVRIYHWEACRHNLSKNESSHLLKGMVLSTEILAIILLWSSLFYFIFHRSLCNKQFGRNLKQVPLPAHSRYLTVFISTFLLFAWYTNFTHPNKCDANKWNDTSTLEFCWWVWKLVDPEQEALQL